MRIEKDWLISWNSFFTTRNFPGKQQMIRFFLLICFKIGLAVGDIESIQKNAELKLLALEVSSMVS